MAISQELAKTLSRIGGEMYRDTESDDIEKVAGLFPRGYISIVASAAGTGKTWFMQYVACQLSVGGKILEGIVAKSPKYKSLIMAGETGKRLLDRRLAQTQWPHEPKNMRIYEAVRMAKEGVPYMLNTREGQETIAAIVELERPAIMWFDTLLSFHTTDESKQGEMTSIYTYLLRMASYYDMAIVLNHHTRKRPNGHAQTPHVPHQDDVIGSSSGVRLANSVYVISKEELAEGMSRMTVRNVKAWDVKVPPFTYEFIKDDSGYTDFKIDFTVEGEANSVYWSARERIKAYVDSLASGAIISLQDIAGYVHLNAETIRRYVEELTKPKQGIVATLEKVQLLGKSAYRVL